MIARLLPTADFAVDARIEEPRLERGTKEQVIDAKPPTAAVVISKEVPEGVDALIGMLLAQRVGPPLCEQAREALPHFGSEQGILDP